MSNMQRCSDCDRCEQQGDNYCRMCDFFFKKGVVKNAKVAVAYSTNEKFCGYCGGPKHSGQCDK